jgi:N-acetylneuraminic acid mutarotase
MRKSAALLLVFVFLTASSLMVAKPAFSSAGVAEDSWVLKAPMQVAKSSLGVAVVNGKIYAIGGRVLVYQDQSRVESKEVNTNEEYDPAANTWTYKKSMPTPSSLFAIAVYNDKIYCMGSGKNQVYNPANDTWENKTAMPTERIMASANVVNGKIYVIGGHPNETLCEVYDPETDAWTTKPPLSTDMFGHAVVYNGKIYVIWGQTRIYDPATGEVNFGAPEPIALPSTSGGDKIGATTGFMAPKRMYVFSGGYNNQVYDPEADTWTAGSTMPTPRGDFAVAVVDDLIYVIGGITISYEGRPLGAGGTVTYYATVEQYTPFGYGTVPPEIAVVSPENKTYTSSNVSLAFTVNKPASWVGYSLDGQDNMTITGNTTLSGLANGSHNITVYAKDEFENTGASETVTFTIAKETEAFPIRLTAAAAIVIAALVLVAAVGVGLSAYLKKRK